MPYKNVPKDVVKARNKLHSSKHYESNKAVYKARKIRWRKKQKKLIHEYVFAHLKEHPCIDCGEKDPIVLEFDHRKSRDKVLSIAEMAQLCRGLGAVIAEIEKCDVRCANCHRRKTYRERKLKHKG